MFKHAHQVTILALPIGNFFDLSDRMKTSLADATTIFCEDTRKIFELAERAKIQIHAKLIALPGNEEFDFDFENFFRNLEEQTKIVWVSDAGTPVLNDPGRALIEFCSRKDVSLHAVPGPSAPILLWQWSGGFGLPFVFGGFAPKSEGKNSPALLDFFTQIPDKGSFCFFDTKHQVLATLEYLRDKELGARKIFVGRDMSKKHEELLQGSVDGVFEELTRRIGKDTPIGELTLLLEGGALEPTQQHHVKLEDLAAIRNSPPKEAAKIAARILGLNTKDCYAAIVKGKDHEEK